MKLFSAKNLNLYTLALLFIIVTIQVKAQSNSAASFTKFNFGLYGGLNFNGSDNHSGLVFFEVKTNLFSDLYLKSSIGFSKIFEPVNFTIKDYRTFTVENEQYFNTEDITVSEKAYDVFPVNLILQYEFNNLILAPYIQAGAGYNFISMKFEKTISSRGYDSYASIPEEYKTNDAPALLSDSYTIFAGVGGKINLSSVLVLDFGYIIKFDTALPDNHNIYFGIYL